MGRIMRITCCLVLLSLWAVNTSEAGIYLDHVDGTLAADTLPTGGVVTFHFGMFVEAAGNVTGSTNGFRVFSPSGANWTSAVGTLTGAITAGMLEQFFVNSFSITGSGADTLGFGGFRLFAPGIPVGFDEIAWTIDIGPISTESHCGEICLDSSWYPPAGLWKWSTTAGDHFPTWDGPHCYTIFDAAQGPCGGSNTPPELAAIGDQSTDEGVNLAFPVSAGDVDGDPLTLTTSTLPGGASFVDHHDGTGDFDWTPDYDQSGVYPITFYVTDGSESDSEAITITVNDINRPPVLASIGNQSTDENVNLVVGISATDPDGDPLEFSITATDLPVGYSFVDNGDETATFDWTPSYDDSGMYSATIDVSDGKGANDFEVISIDVNNINRPPSIDPVADEDATVGEFIDITIVSNDPDGDVISLVPLGVIPPGAVFTDNTDGTGSLQWTPQIADVGNWPQAIIASDGMDEDTVFFLITIHAPNNPPQIDPIADQFISECDTLVVIAVASDPDEDPLSLWADGLETNMMFTDNADGTGEFRFTPSFAQAGLYNIEIFVTDGLDTAVTSFAIDVENCQPSEFNAEVDIDPDTIFAAWANSVEPLSGYIYFGNFSDAHLPSEVDESSLLINGTIPAISTTVVDSIPGFSGDVLQIEYSQELFILGYGAFYDFSVQTYNLSGSFTDELAFSIDGDAILRGRLRGDVNLDDVVDISDITMLVSYFFGGGAEPLLMDVADLNSNGVFDITDLTLLIQMVFVDTK